MPVIYYVSGKSLPINFATWSHTNQSTGNDKNFTSVPTSIAHYRLKYIFVFLTTAESVACKEKEANNLFHPIAVKLNDGYDVEDEHSFPIQMGPNKCQNILCHR